MGALRTASAVVSGWPPGLGSVARCGAQGCALCCKPQRASLALTEWPPSLAAQASASILSKHQRQHQSRSRSCVTALKGFTSPPPNPAALAAPGSQSPAPCSFPCSPSPPRAAPAGGLPLRRCLAGFTSPHPADASPSHSKLRNGSRRDKTRFNNKTTTGSDLGCCYDVAVAGGKVTAGR